MSEKDIQYHGFPDCLQYADIRQALYDIFGIIEIRAKLGIVGNVVMELRMKEEGSVNHFSHFTFRLVVGSQPTVRSIVSSSS